jgi:hypothetical protein
MYAGTTIRDGSGRFIGVHQKIDRVARRNIEPILPDWCNFPDIKNILHFEGKNGPDGVKRKSPAVDEPWHFINPDDPNDTALLEMIDGHIGNLARALQTNNSERAAFEAAWMAYPRFKDAIPSDDEILQVKNHGYREYYLDQVHADSIKFLGQFLFCISFVSSHAATRLTYITRILTRIA